MRFRLRLCYLQFQRMTEANKKPKMQNETFRRNKMNLRQFQKQDNGDTRGILVYKDEETDYADDKKNKT